MNMIENLERLKYDFSDFDNPENEKVYETMGILGDYGMQKEKEHDKNTRKNLVKYYNKMVKYIYKNHLEDDKFGWAALPIIYRVISRDGNWKKLNFTPERIKERYENELVKAKQIKENGIQMIDIEAEACFKTAEYYTIKRDKHK